MTALELMAACRRTGQEIGRLKERLQELMDAATHCTATVDGVGGGRNAGDRLAAVAARSDELEGRLREALKNYCAEQSAGILLTEALEAMPRRCLRRFYVYGESVSRIAMDMQYTVSNVYKALASGRQSLEAIPEAEVEAKLPIWYVDRHIRGVETE